MILVSYWVYSSMGRSNVSCLQTCTNSRGKDGYIDRDIVRQMDTRIVILIDRWIIRQIDILILNLQLNGKFQRHVSCLQTCTNSRGRGGQIDRNVVRQIYGQTLRQTYILILNLQLNGKIQLFLFVDMYKLQR